MSPRFAFRVSVLAVALALVGVARATSLYKVKDLGTLGGDISFGAAIARGKLVAGTSTTTITNPPYTYRAFLYREGVMTDLGVLWDGGYSFALAVNASGQACGDANWTDYLDHAVIYADGGITDLAAMRDDFLVSQCTGIDSAGHVAGTAVVYPDLKPHAFFYGDGRFDIYDSESWANGLNDHDQMVGRAGIEAALFEHGRTTMLGTLGGLYSEAFAINDDGQATGWASMEGDVVVHTVVWHDGKVDDLGTLGGPQSQGMAINRTGVVVGWSYTTVLNEAHAFVAFHNHMADLNKLLDPLTGLGWMLGNASGVDDFGRIVGTGTHDGEYHAYELTPMIP
jgi:probable HAF family extracellular repeat protein